MARFARYTVFSFESRDANDKVETRDMSTTSARYAAKCEGQVTDHQFVTTKYSTLYKINLFETFFSFFTIILIINQQSIYTAMMCVMLTVCYFKHSIMRFVYYYVFLIVYYSIRKKKKKKH